MTREVLETFAREFMDEDDLSGYSDEELRGLVEAYFENLDYIEQGE